MSKTAPTAEHEETQSDELLQNDADGNPINKERHFNLRMIACITLLAALGCLGTGAVASSAWEGIHKTLTDRNRVDTANSSFLPPLTPTLSPDLLTVVTDPTIDPNTSDTLPQFQPDHYESFVEYYTTQKGDHWMAIGRKLGVEESKLLAFSWAQTMSNKIIDPSSGQYNPHYLPENLKVTIAYQRLKKSGVNPQPQVDASTYTVKSGDTFYKIAEMFGAQGLNRYACGDQLMNANGYTKESARKLQINATLKLQAIRNCLTGLGNQGK